MPVPDQNEIVIIGIGNDSRGDDGLGWAFIDELENDPGMKARLLQRYQLQPEDAAEIAHARVAIFVDASKEVLEAGFLWEPCVPERQPIVHSHWLPPSAVLGLCYELGNSCPEAFLLSIWGEQWELGQSLSPGARKRLEDALTYFRQWYREWGLST